MIVLRLNASQRLSMGTPDNDTMATLSNVYTRLREVIVPPLNASQRPSMATPDNYTIATLSNVNT